MRRWIAPAAALAVLLLVCPGARAGTPTEQLRGSFAAVMRVLEDPETEGRHEERLTAIRAIAREMFDLREAAQLSLGPAWNDRTPAEREEFVRVFSELLERSFIAGIAARIQLADGVKVSFTGESVDGFVATVRTTILSKSGLELPFDYRMAKRGGGRWAVRDVVIDGVSLVANYRAQFARVIQTSSYADLVQQMQARVSTPPAPVATVAADRPVIVPVTSAPPPAAPGAQKPFDATPRQRIAQAGDVKEREPALAIRSARRQPPEAIPIARAKLEPRPAPAPGNQWVQPAQLQVATAAYPRSEDATSARSYWVQVAAFKNLEAAMRLASLLRAEKTPVSERWAVVMEPATPGTTLARVRVGPFPDRAEAASNLRELQALGYKPFIAEERD